MNKATFTAAYAVNLRNNVMSDPAEWGYNPDALASVSDDTLSAHFSERAETFIESLASGRMNKDSKAIKDTYTAIEAYLNA